MGSEYAVEMKNITKRFGGLIAVDNVSLQIKSGEIHALCGENGAGKSTLMNVLTGKFPPNEGEIYLKGEKKKIQIRCQTCLTINFIGILIMNLFPKKMPREE